MMESSQIGPQIGAGSGPQIGAESQNSSVSSISLQPNAHNAWGESPNDEMLPWNKKCRQLAQFWRNIMRQNALGSSMFVPYELPSSAAVLPIFHLTDTTIMIEAENWRFDCS